MAEALMNEKLKRAGVDDVRATSAGTWTAEGAALSANAERVLAERGLDLGDHRAHNVTEEDMAVASLVLAMTRNHAEALRVDFPAHADKVHLFSEMAGRHFDVPDPYRAPLATYRQTADIIATILEQGYERIMSALVAEQGDP